MEEKNYNFAYIAIVAIVAVVAVIVLALSVTTNQRVVTATGTSVDTAGQMYKVAIKPWYQCTGTYTGTGGMYADNSLEPCECFCRSNTIAGRTFNINTYRNDCNEESCIAAYSTRQATEY